MPHDYLTVADVLGCNLLPHQDDFGGTTGEQTGLHLGFCSGLITVLLRYFVR